MRILLPILIFLAACGSEEPLPPPPPPKPPGASLVPTVEKFKVYISQLDKDTADEEESSLAQSVADKPSRENAITALVESASDPRPKIREHVLGSILKTVKYYKYRDDRFVEVSLKLLEDPTPWVRTAASDCLKVLCSKKSVQPLLAQMSLKGATPEQLENPRQALAFLAGLPPKESTASVKKWWAQNEATFDEQKCIERADKGD